MALRNQIMLITYPDSLEGICRISSMFSISISRE